MELFYILPLTTCWLHARLSRIMRLKGTYDLSASVAHHHHGAVVHIAPG